MSRRSQADRRSDTRARLLRSAAALFAARGVDAVSVDAVADDADRTSGAVYAHFGSKQGLVTALLDSWTSEAAAVVADRFAAAPDSADRLRALWSSFADPDSELGPDWSLLEHELWLRAARDPELTESAARRYAWSRRRLAEGSMSSAADAADQQLSAESVATLVLALLLGLEMQHRLDPDAVPDDLVVAGLGRVLALAPRQPTKENHAHAAV
jgi:AcrR family transcriptional regulator